MVISHAIPKSRMWGKFSLLVVLALLLPIVLGFFPPLPSGSAAAFERDLAASLCIGGEEDGSPISHGDHEQCCILCPAGSSMVPPLDASVSVPPPGRAAVLHDITIATVTATPSGDDWHLARGPPAA